MSWIQRKAFAVVAAGLGLAAVFGGTLGAAVALHQTDLSASGVNYVGGPSRAEVQAKDFVSCLPKTAWASIYIWDSVNQRWYHYFNTNSGIPAYVNGTAVGGISTIPRFSGVAIFMNTAVSQAKFPDQPNEACAG